MLLEQLIENSCHCGKYSAGGQEARAPPRLSITPRLPPLFVSSTAILRTEWMEVRKQRESIYAELEPKTNRVPRGRPWLRAIGRTETGFLRFPRRVVHPNSRTNWHQCSINRLFVCAEGECAAHSSRYQQLVGRVSQALPDAMISAGFNSYLSISSRFQGLERRCEKRVRSVRQFG